MGFIEKLNHRALIHEFFASFSLIFIGSLSVISMNFGEVTTGANLLLPALAHGIVILVFIYTAGYEGAGHFVPTVTIGLLVIRKIGIVQALTDIIIQFVASFVAGGMVYFLIPKAYEGRGLGYEYIYENTNKRYIQVFVSEFLGSFYLLYIVVACIQRKASPALFGTMVGATVVFLVFAIEIVSGTQLSPFRGLGPSVIDGHFGRKGDWIFWVASILGGIAGALFYEHVLDRPKQGDIIKEETEV